MLYEEDFEDLKLALLIEKEFVSIKNILIIIGKSNIWQIYFSRQFCATWPYKITYLYIDSELKSRSK